MKNDILLLGANAADPSLEEFSSEELRVTSIIVGTAIVLQTASLLAPAGKRKGFIDLVADFAANMPREALVQARSEIREEIQLRS